MADLVKSEADHIEAARKALVDAALVHVVFDGWSDATLNAAIQDTGVDPGLAKQAFPRGPVDLALAFHFDGDAQMVQALNLTNLEEMRYSARVAHAISTRLHIAAPHKEAVRRGLTFFALPTHAADGARAVWHTADAIWNALGDTSLDVNWYTKRMTLGAVYSACVLYWLGDESDGHADTEAFIKRRIEDVMQIEKAKAGFRKSGFGKVFTRTTSGLFDLIRAPQQGGFDGAK